MKEIKKGCYGNLEGTPRNKNTFTTLFRDADGKTINFERWSCKTLKCAIKKSYRIFEHYVYCWDLEKISSMQIRDEATGEIVRDFQAEQFFFNVRNFVPSAEYREICNEKLVAMEVPLF